MRTRIAAVSAAALTPFLVLLVRSAHARWLATGDYSLIELRTRAVGGRHTPLLGPYSRFGWEHPGPALFFAFALPYRVLSERSTGLLAGTTLGGALTTVVVVFVLLRMRVSPVVAAAGLLVGAILVHALGASFLWNPWNPYVIVLPFLALVLVCWWAANGEARVLPVGVALASFAVQTHVSLAPEAIALLVVALAWLSGTTARDARGRTRLLRSLVASAAVATVMWSPPVIQQLQPNGGNLTLLVKFWTTPHHLTLGFGNGARILASELAIRAPWVNGRQSGGPFSAGVPIPSFAFPTALLVLVIASAVAWRRRDQIAITLCSIALTSVFVAWFSFAKIIGPPYPYVIRWAWVVSAVCWLASAAALLPALVDRIGARAAVWLPRALSCAAAVLIVLVAVDAFTATTPDAAMSHAASAVAAEALPRLQGRPGPILAIPVGDSADPLLGGLVAAGVEHGIDVRYDTALQPRAGSNRVVAANHAGTVVVVASDDSVRDYASRGEYREIARYDSLTPAERREFARINAEVNAVAASDLPTFVPTHTALIKRLEVLTHKSILVAVFLRVPTA